MVRAPRAGWPASGSLSLPARPEPAPAARARAPGSAPPSPERRRRRYGDRSMTGWGRRAELVVNARQLLGDRPQPPPGLLVVGLGRRPDDVRVPALLHEAVRADERSARQPGH